MKKAIISLTIIAGSIGLSCMFILFIHAMANSKKEYQLDATPKGYILYSGSEKLGFIPASNTALDSLIENHNR